MKANELKAYASTFGSYLIRKLPEELNSINQIILYGSVARGDATLSSDVDIFFDTPKPGLEKRIKLALASFYESREALLFKMKKIENKISVKVGELKKWKELHQSISTTGIVLWGSYKPTALPGGAKQMLAIYWTEIGKNRGAFLNRLYGFRSKGKEYPGLLKKFNGEKLGKSSILIPFQHKDEFLVLLKKYLVKARQKVVFVSE